MTKILNEIRIYTKKKSTNIERREVEIEVGDLVYVKFR